MKIGNKTVLALALCVGLYSNASSETVAEYKENTPNGYKYSNETFYNLPLNFQSPHINWAGPNAFGKLKTFVIVPNTAVRDVMELKQRIPMDTTVLRTKMHEKFSTEKGYIFKLSSANLLKFASDKLSNSYKYDAIIIGKVKWSILPKKLQKLILNKVKSGTTLVLVSPWDVDKKLMNEIKWSSHTSLEESIKSSVPMSILPLDKDLDKDYPECLPRKIGPLEIKEGKYGEGTVVLLDYHDLFVKDKKRHVLTCGTWNQQGLRQMSLTPYIADDPLLYEYYFSILGKILYSASGKTSGIEISSEKAFVSVGKKSLPSAPVKFKISVKDKGTKNYKFYYELRNRANKVLEKGKSEVTISKNGAEFAPKLPRLKNGIYVVDLWAKRGDNVLCWASVPLEVTGVDYIKSIAIDKEFFGQNEAISGKIKSGAPLKNGLKMTLELWDTHKRLIQKIDMAKDSKDFKFKVIENPLSRTYRIACKITDNKGFVVNSEEAWTGLPNSKNDDFQFIMWAGGKNTRANKVIMKKCQDFGVTGYYDTSATWSPQKVLIDSADFIAQNNMIAYPYCYGLWDFCITPQNSMEKQVKNYSEKIYPAKVKAYRRYGAMAYSINEEDFIDRNEKKWNNPEALKDYHKYLKERYGNIHELNKIWGSEFKSLEDIKFISFIDAKVKKTHTQWLEQKLHRIDRFNKIHEVAAATVRKYDPGAKVGFDCTHGMDFDWPRMAKTVNSFTQAPLEELNKGKKFYTGTWVGYYLEALDEYSMRVKPWRYAFMGGTHMMWWPVAGAFTPDVSEPYLCMKQCSEEMADLTSGSGKLLMSSNKRIDPILIFWSNASYHAGILNPQELSWECSKDAFKNMLRRLGFDFRSVSPEYIQSKLKYNEDNRVLILPASQAISKKTADAIKKFTEEGGLLIADFKPAVMDEHLRPYAKTGKTQDKINFVTCSKCKGKKRVEIGNAWQPCPHCGGVGKIAKEGKKAKTKSVLKDIFGFSKKGVKKYGEGYGFYLNGPLGDEAEWSGLRKILTEYGKIKTDVEILDKLGNLRTDLRSYIFDNGPGIFLGIIPDRSVKNPPGSKAVVKLNKAYYIYNVRLQKYMGHAKSFEVAITKNRAKLYAFLPARIEGTKLTINKTEFAPEENVVINGKIEPSSLGECALVARVVVTSNGRELKELTRNVAYKGNFSYTIPLALNQETGTYKVTVEDIMSGFTRELKFKLK